MHIHKASSGLVSKGRWTLRFHNEDTGETREIIKDNLTPDVMLEALSVQLEGTQTYDIGGVPYIAIGNDGSNPTAADPALGNETARKITAVQTRTGTANEYVVFFNKGEVTGNHREIGIFMDGNTSQVTAVANTGILGSRIQEDFSVGAAETLTLTFTFTFTRP